MSATRSRLLWSKIDQDKMPVYMGVHALAVLAATAYEPLCPKSNAAQSVMEAGAAAYELTLGVSDLAQYLGTDVDGAYEIIDKINGWFMANDMTCLKKPIRQVMADMQELRDNSLELNQAINARSKLK